MDADLVFNTNPVPGMSLTGEPGNYPWEQPPKYVKLADVVDFYTERLTSDEAVDGIADVLSRDATVTDLANTFMKASVMQGIHSVDVGLIAFPIIAEIIKTIGDISGVGYKTTPEDSKKPKAVSEKMLKEIIAEVKSSVKDREKPQPKGLMARGENNGY